MLRGGAAQGFGRLGWFVEQVEESIAVAVRERGRHLLVEAELVLACRIQRDPRIIPAGFGLDLAGPGNEQDEGRPDSFGA
jgi:hypothetical protein